VTAFSLLLPVYARDDPQQLRRAFESSVQEQTRRPDEVVLVQDGPVPDALAVAIAALVEASPVPVRHLVLPVNVGLAEALTAGLDACAHDVVARMDADDVALPGRFEAQLAVIEQGYDLVGAGLLEFVDDEQVTVGRRTPPIGEEVIQRYARFHDPFNHPTVVYRRSAVRRAGGYQAGALMEDYWLFARMLQAGARVANLPEPLVKYRVGAGAYARRGGLRQLRAELHLQRQLHHLGFTTLAQYLRNVLVRGGYRLLPESVRRTFYRRVLHRDFRDGAAGGVA
jgi:glycosyltransferase involved in cell wall biosynthesis